VKKNWALKEVSLIFYLVAADVVEQQQIVGISWSTKLMEEWLEEVVEVVIVVTMQA